MSELQRTNTEHTGSIPSELTEFQNRIQKLAPEIENIDEDEMDFFNIELSRDVIDELMDAGVVGFASCCGVSRASDWLLSANCAVLTTWRPDKTRCQNDCDNRQLSKRLRELGYGVTKLRGCYVDKQHRVNKENSFLVVDLVGRESDFYSNIYNLSSFYKQDCFLYKSKEDSTAYLVGTNDDFGRNRIEYAGELCVNDLEATNYSEVGSGRIAFC